MAGASCRNRRAGALLLAAALAAGGPASGWPASVRAPAALFADSLVDSLPAYELDPVEVVGQGWHLPGEGAVIAWSVMDGSALARAGILRLADALAPLPGVRVARFGAPGTFSTLSVRGTRNEQVLVLVDGRRLSPAQGGGVDAGALDVGAVERIEVLRGGSSALYGAGALGGVINLVTRPAAGRPGDTTLRLEGGSFGTVAGALRHDRPAGADGRIWFRGHGLRTEGDYRYDDRGVLGERENADARGSGGALGLHLRPAAPVRLTVDSGFDGSDQGVPGTVEFPTPDARRSDRRASTAAELVLDRSATGLRLEARGHRLRQRRSYRDASRGIDDRHVNHSTGIELRADRSFAKESEQSPFSGQRRKWGPGLVTAGAELRHDHLLSTSDGDRERTSAGLTLRAQLARGPLRIAPASRLDLRSDGAPFLSPRLALHAELPGGYALRFATGRSYRPPSFDDLFFPDVGGALGNPELEPERALDVEMGADARFGRGPRAAATLTASAYRQRIDDLIQWSPGPDGRWRPHNVGRALLRGVEIEGRARLGPGGRAGPAELALVIDLLDARNRTGEPNVDGRRLPYRPAIEGYLELVVPAASRLRLISAWHGVGESAVTEANTKSVPGHGLLDMTVEIVLWRAAAQAATRAGVKDSPDPPDRKDRVVASFAVLNLTDIAAVDVRDYPLPGREWRLALRLAAAEGP